MKRYLLTLIGLALLGGSPLWAAECGACDQAAGKACGRCCPHCGTCLVPVCHISCTTKKTTEYKYKCVCETICIPPVTPLCEACGGCGKSCGCADECDKGCSKDNCGCKCRVREVKKLVKYPVTKETPVRTCTVEWTCPNCAKAGACGVAVAASPDELPPPPR
jgi:hypothetical protein